MKGLKQNIEISDSSMNIAPDTFLLSNEYRNFEKFRRYKQALSDGKDINADSLVASNPGFYHAYVLAADYLYKRKDYPKALTFYKTALTKEIATKNEAEHIRKQIKKIENLK